ncbi:MAG: ABC transporter ATP-binding protein [Pirellulales bacterium]|nr:ABC transporter ATP-binding protein [Pirellulales bacterium]
MRPSPAIVISNISFAYSARQALANLSLDVASGEIFALLGPNGSGKSTLFRLLATLIPLQQGEIDILSISVRTHAVEVRKRLGVVFQSPSVDAKLRVWENIRHQGWLYGLSGRELTTRGQELLAQLGLADRAHDSVETLSGGLRRRLELAKGMLHCPSILLMDEPSTGLDPAARYDFWTYLRQLRDEHGVTVLLTTHLLEEADHADRVAILSEGQIVACGAPEELRKEVGQESIVVHPIPDHAKQLAAGIAQRLNVQTRTIEDEIHVTADDATATIASLLEQFGPMVSELRLGKPTLEDVFVARTGHRFWNRPADGDSLDAKGRANRKGVRNG